MKKALALLLALVMCLSLCACGGNEPSTQTPQEKPTTNEVAVETTTEPEVEVEEKIYKLGDTIETNLFKITPSFTGYAEKLANWPDENYMTPAGNFSGESPYSASDGKTAIYGEMQIEYIGNEKSNVILNIGVSANYDDGYMFEYAHMGNCVSLGGDWKYDGSMVFEPLSDSTTRILRYCIEVPKQVEENKEKSLIVTFFVNGERFDYDFRSAEVLGSDYNPRGELYQPLDDSTKTQIITYLKNNGLEQWGWYDKTFGLLTFTFEDTAVSATLPINSSYQYDFVGTYEVLSGTILISWDYGDKIHLDYTFDGTSLEVVEFDYETD